MKKVFLIVALNALFFAAYSQVGIGNVSPDNNSILDLSNTSNRGLLLPKSASIYPTTPSGLLFFNESDSIIYYNQGGAYNGLSAWKYKFGGSISENTYYTKTGNVGIGTSAPSKKLHVADNGEVIIIEGTNHSYFGLYNTGYLNGRGASFGFINASTTNFTIKNELLNGDINLTTLGAGDVNVTNGDVDIEAGKVKEYGNELMPQGAIIMWSGNTAPDGWALCDGGSYAKVDGSGNVTVPNLQGRFVVGYDAGDADYNSVGDNGGNKSNTHTHNVNPPSTTTSSNGDHTHTGTTDAGDSNKQKTHTCCDRDNMAKSDHKHPFTTDPGGSHSHTLNVAAFDSGTPSDSENRPPYYTLAYIYKL